MTSPVPRPGPPADPDETAEQRLRELSEQTAELGGAEAGERLHTGNQIIAELETQLERLKP